MRTKDKTTIPGAEPEASENKGSKKQPTTDPALTDPEKTPGSGMMPDKSGDAPSG
jgi:hypothetical protein